MNTIEELTRLLAEDFRVDPERITVDRQLGDYGIDSLGLFDLLFVVEEHFAIDLPTEMADYRTLGALAALVDRIRLRCPA